MSGAPEPLRGTRSSTARRRDDAEQLGEAQSLSPTWRQRLSSRRLWIMVAVIAVVSAGAGLLLQGMFQASASLTLDPESAKPDGGKAIVEVMRQQGIEVELADSFDEVRSAVGDDGASTTIVLQQRDVQLDADQLADLAALGAANLVVLRPGPQVLDALDTDIVSGGYSAQEEGATAPVGDRCADPLAQNAPEISRLGGPTYSVPEGEGYAACYTVNDRYSVAIDDTGDTRLIAIGATTNLTNEFVATDANGAMGIGLLGDTERLIWYQPGAADLDTTNGVSPIESLVPAWLTPAMVLIIITGIATIVWRGRRLGPLAIERLPVVVPASETMEGRARLYGRTESRLRALDNLRIGTIGRLAKMLALPASTGAYEVAVSVAQTLARPREEVVTVLIEASPASDTELVELSDHLLRLERACRAALAIPDELSRTNAEPHGTEPDASASRNPMHPTPNPAPNTTPGTNPNTEPDSTPPAAPPADPSPSRGDA